MWLYEITLKLQHSRAVVTALSLMPDYFHLVKSCMFQRPVFKNINGFDSLMGLTGPDFTLKQLKYITGNVHVYPYNASLLWEFLPSLLYNPFKLFTHRGPSLVCVCVYILNGGCHSQLGQNNPYGLKGEQSKSPVAQCGSIVSNSHPLDANRNPKPTELPLGVRGPSLIATWLWVCTHRFEWTIEKMVSFFFFS